MNALAISLLLSAQVDTSTTVFLFDDGDLEATEAETHDVDEIEITATRLAETARPDTELRLTGAQLLERGVTNLAQALDLVSDTPVRSAGRGGFQTDIRGARKGGVSIFLDGIPIADPYLGNFDVSSIPATDIAEIRVALTPSSPLDGPGGNGGVIEVLTRSAAGKAGVRVHAQASDAPGGTVAAAARGTIPGVLSVRASAQGGMGNREWVIDNGNGRETGREDARGGSAGLRLERGFPRGRVAADFGVARRAFVAPPTDQLDGGDLDVLYIKREDMFRGVLSGELLRGPLVLSARAYSLVIDREADRYSDVARALAYRSERVLAQRSGGALQADYNAGESLRFTLVSHLLVEGGRQDAHNYDAAGAAILPTSDGGVAPILEPAGGVHWIAARWLAIDLAAGLAVPLGLGAAPWPEAKTTVTFTGADTLELRLTGARKGRLPSVRDRFDTLTGNPAVGAELSSSVELGARWRPLDALRLDLSGYYRYVEGLIRLGLVPGSNGAPGGFLSANIGDVVISGFEVRGDLELHAMLSAGAAYQFAHQAYAGERPGGASSDTPLDFFPAHRAEASLTFRPLDRAGAWTRARYTGDRADKGNTLPGYIAVDAAVWGQLDAVRVNLRVENLLDTAYDLRTGVPGFGRTILFGMEATLE